MHVGEPTAGDPGCGGLQPDSGRDGTVRCPPAAWRRMVEAFNDAVWLLDSEQRIVCCNAACCELFGRAAGELVGRYCWDIVHGTVQAIVECPVRRMVHSGRRETMELCWGGRWHQVTVDPVKLPGGKGLGAVHIIRDITDQKRLAEGLVRLNAELEQRIEERTARLCASETTYRALLENTLDIPCSIGVDGILHYVGPQVRRYGFDPATLQGRHFLEVVWSEDRERVGENFKKTLVDGISPFANFRIHAPDGCVYWFEERSTIHRDATGAITEFIGLLRDVTEAKRAEGLRAEHQRQLHRLAGKLASAQDDEQRRIAEGLHDDVAQLLAAASIKVALCAKVGDSRKTQAFLGQVGELIRDAHDKIRLLSFELASSTLYKLGLYEAIGELCEGMTERYGVRFRVVDGGIPADALDETSATVLFKAARELLFNVVKHAGARTAKVLVHDRDGCIELVVEDDGQGFPEPGDAYEIGFGKGLGLFGIRERLQDLGGTLRVESQPHVRTCVTLSIPLGEGAAGRGVAHRSARRAGKAGHK